jgi:hypothetical protein
MDTMILADPDGTEPLSRVMLVILASPCTKRYRAGGARLKGAKLERVFDTTQI